MEPLPRISIVTACYNSEHTIRETIESVIRQNYANFEHIIVDGGSSDATLDIIRQYPHILWSSAKDEGVYDAMNKGIVRATGDIVVMLNSDDCFCPGVLNKVGASFNENPTWDGLFGDIIYVDGADKEIFRRREAVFDYNVLRFSGVGYVIHQTLFVKKSVHDRLGLYNHRKYLSCADFDFILRLGKAGLKIGHINCFIVRYRYHEFGQSADMRMVRNIQTESRLICSEHGKLDGSAGCLIAVFYRLKRQLQKLAHHGTCDLIPGKFLLRSHLKEATKFSSNVKPAGI